MTPRPTRPRGTHVRRFRPPQVRASGGNSAASGARSWRHGGRRCPRGSVYTVLASAPSRKAGAMIRTHSRYVIIGAGIHGLSTAWHLARDLLARGLGSGEDILV